MRLLHLSDLHFGTKDDATTWFNQLAEDLKHELHCTTVDCLALSGDIAETADMNEFNAADAFLSKLCEEFRLPKDRIVIAPGNHDVDWSESRLAYEVVKQSDFAKMANVVSYKQNSADYVEVVRDANLYRNRFANFASFYRAVTGESYGLNYDEQYGLMTFADAKVAIVSFNSAWHTDHHHPSRSGIQPGALNMVLETLRSAPQLQECRKIAVWHHPMRGDGQISDPSFLERLAVAGFSVVLHGHIHKPQSDQFKYDVSAEGRQIHFIGAGTLGSLHVHRGYPWQYNLLTIDEGALKVQSRAKTEPHGAWKPDARFVEAQGMPPSDSYSLVFVPVTRQQAALVKGPDSRLEVRRTSPLETMSDLKDHLQQQGWDVTGYRIAVEALIFNHQGRLLLQKRGELSRDEVGKLEGVGGQVKGEESLTDCLRSHVQKEIGPRVKIGIDQLLEVRPTRFVERAKDPQDWIVVSYLCRLLSGKPVIVDRERTAKLSWLTLDQLYAAPDEDLSRSTSRARDLYRVKYGTRPYFEEGA
jgi:predicted MPP superfamily phosphohydrolase/ADP-ribose pyrophosphatase YjhB (NUDIX family)